MLFLALYRVRSNGPGTEMFVMDYERRRKLSKIRDTPICK